jgi:hypothetical protein
MSVLKLLAGIGSKAVYNPYIDKYHTETSPSGNIGTITSGGLKYIYGSCYVQSGKYLYTVTNQGTNEGYVKVFDISSGVLVEVGSHRYNSAYATDGTNPTCAYLNPYTMEFYFQTTFGSSNGYVYDVSVPTSPTQLTNAGTRNGYTGTQLPAVDTDEILYTSNSTSTPKIKSVDIANYTSTPTLGTFSPAQSFHTLVLNDDGLRAYTTYAGNVTAVNLTAPASMSQYAYAASTTTSANTGSGLAVKGSYVYRMDYNYGCITYDSSLNSVGNTLKSPNIQSGSGLTVITIGDDLLVATEGNSNGILSTFDISNPASPVAIDAAALTGSSNANIMAYYNGVLTITNGSTDSIYYVDIT